MITLLLITYILGAIYIIVDGKLFDACLVIYYQSSKLATFLFLLFTIIWPITLALFFFREKKAVTGDVNDG